MNIQDNCEAFDWAYALYYWLSHHHEGQTSDKYAVLSNMPNDYQMTNIPSIDFDDNDCDEYEMSVMYYHELDEDNWQEYNTEFKRYMNDDFDNNSY